MTIDLGMPQPAHEPLAPRRKSRQIMVGKDKHAVPVGGGAPVSVQSMTTTLTADVNATLQQIAELTATGCQIVRVAVPSSGQAIGSITLPATGAIAHTGVGFSSDGKYLVTATAGTGGPADPGQITEWAFSPSLWSEIACASAGHALTSNEWQEYVGPGGPAMPSQLACGS
jgi:hypothetical protein